MTGMQVAFGALVGGVTGAAFFAGLWWTVQRVVASGHGPVWIAVSGLVRGSLAIGGFWLALQSGPLALAVALVAFLGVRFAAIGVVGRPELPAESAE